MTRTTTVLIDWSLMKVFIVIILSVVVVVYWGTLLWGWFMVIILHY